MSSPAHEPTPSGPRIRDAGSADTVKILLATDSHIGYMERDPIRGQDAINTFREILQLAVKHDVDFILLAGDLFHENRPSRDCIYRTVALLREYTLGDKPVQIELCSDPLEGKAQGFSFPAINYEDPNFNVAIPVFSIHGNHDDPQGAGPEGALCALDLLSVTGLLNYIGKTDLPTTDSDAQNSGIAIKPVLLKKGETKIGLYGVGNVKDSRMHFELRSNRVRMFMPKEKQDWFNIMLIHQNRVKHGPQECVPEGMFDDSINLVVWGHEHDCRIVPEPVAGKQYFISQPGSSVATSLAEGESITKHAALLQIQNMDFQITPLILRTVRPFKLEEIVLSEVAEEEGLDLSDKMEIHKYLKDKVNSLITIANHEFKTRNADVELDIPSMLPLIRLKVDTTGVSEMANPIRFGQEFQGKIANPRDVLVFHRARRQAPRSSKVKVDQPELMIDDPDLTIGEKLARVRVHDLVQEYLAAQQLQILGENGMSDAIQTFVDKDDPHSIGGYVSASMKDILKSVQDANVDEEALETALARAKDKREEEYQEKKTQKKVAKKSAKAVASDAESVDSMVMEVDMPSEEDIAPKKAPKAPPKKASTASKAKAKAPTRGKKKAVTSDEDEEDMIDIDDDDDENSEPTKPKKRGATSSTSVNKAAKKAPAKKASTKQTAFSFVPSGRTAAARTTGAKKKVIADRGIDMEG